MVDENVVQQQIQTQGGNEFLNSALSSLKNNFDQLVSLSQQKLLYLAIFLLATFLIYNFGIKNHLSGIGGWIVSIIISLFLLGFIIGIANFLIGV